MKSPSISLNMYLEMSILFHRPSDCSPRCNIYFPGELHSLASKSSKLASWLFWRRLFAATGNVMQDTVRHGFLLIRWSIRHNAILICHLFWSIQVPYTVTNNLEIPESSLELFFFFFPLRQHWSDSFPYLVNMDDNFCLWFVAVSILVTLLST